MTEGFGIVDYGVVAATLLFSLIIGIYYACASKQTNEDLLVGGRNMRVWPVACSILVTYLSAITVLGYPAEIYAHGIQIYMLTLTCIVFVPLTAYCFVYPFYGMKLTSVYEYLERRFENRPIRLLASFVFILQCVLITGVVIYAPSIALQQILGLPVWVSLVGIGLCGTVYTAIGGLKAVVWTDVFQFFMILIGMTAMVIRGFWKSGGVMEAFEKADEHGRLNLFDLTVDPFMRHNTLNFVLGYGSNIMFMYGTYQPQVQRYCSLPSLNQAVKSLLLSIALNIVTMSIVLATGVAIFATYAGCDPVLLGQIKKADQIVPYFVMHELYFIPGMMGLFVSCIFSAVLSTLSSMLNSLAAVTWQDFFSGIPTFRKMSDAGQANISRTLAAVFGVVCVLVAFAAQYMGPVLQATLTAVGATSGALGGVFIQGLFMPCVNKWGALSGLVSGLSAMIYIAIMSFQLDKPYHVPLPTSVADCPIGMDTSAADSFVPPQLGHFDWPEKLYTLSYIIYPFAGALISTMVALPISILTGGCCTARKIKKTLLHPSLRGCFGADDHLVAASLSRTGSPDMSKVLEVNYRAGSPMRPPDSAASSPSFYYYSPLPTSPGKGTTIRNNGSTKEYEN